MNRRNFIKSTALALPSVAVLGAISTQSSTYRSATSLFTNEDMTEWCNKNGIYYAKDDELNKQFFKSPYIDVTAHARMFPFETIYSYRDYYRDMWINFIKANYPNCKFLIKDIYKSYDICGKDSISVDFLVDEKIDLLR